MGAGAGTSAEGAETGTSATVGAETGVCGVATGAIVGAETGIAGVETGAVVGGGTGGELTGTGTVGLFTGALAGGAETGAETEGLGEAAVVGAGDLGIVGAGDLGIVGAVAVTGGTVFGTVVGAAAGDWPPTVATTTQINARDNANLRSMSEREKKRRMCVGDGDSKRV